MDNYSTVNQKLKDQFVHIDTVQSDYLLEEKINNFKLGIL